MSLINQKFSFVSISPKDKIFLNYENLKPIFCRTVDFMCLLFCLKLSVCHLISFWIFALEYISFLLKPVLFLIRNLDYICCSLYTAGYIYVILLASQDIFHDSNIPFFFIECLLMRPYKNAQECAQRGSCVAQERPHKEEIS